MKFAVAGALLSLFAANGIADSAEVERMIAEMRQSGASVRTSVDTGRGLVMVGVGRAQYKPESVNMCREAARIDAIREVTGALKTAFHSKTVAALNMEESGGTSKTEMFFSSFSESSIDQVVKGAQVLSSGKNEQGEMEVIVMLSSKLKDASDVLLVMQKKWGDNGVVSAVGIDEDRHLAEQDALRSAVEQVAGTLVIGKVAVNEREELHKRLSTTAGALVDEYRIVRETKVDAEFNVEIVARVSKRKLYDSYRSYFKCLDNPKFFIEATDPALARAFTKHFVDKGFSITEDVDEAQYKIKLDGRFRERTNPVTGNPGTMLALTVEIVSVDGSTVLMRMNEKQAKDSDVLTREQRTDAVCERIFEKLKQQLDQAIHNMVIRMLDDDHTKATIRLDS